MDAICRLRLVLCGKGDRALVASLIPPGTETSTLAAVQYGSSPERGVSLRRIAYQMKHAHTVYNADDKVGVAFIYQNSVDKRNFIRTEFISLIPIPDQYDVTRMYIDNVFSYLRTDKLWMHVRSTDWQRLTVARRIGFYDSTEHSDVACFQPQLVGGLNLVLRRSTFFAYTERGYRQVPRFSDDELRIVLRLIGSRQRSY